jgi:Amt family ammonium transporter
VRGLIPPAEFISFAERTGLIVPLGDRVLEEACRQARAWHLEMSSDEPIGISVNVSPVQLQDPGLSERVKRVLESTELAPRYLTLEITESVLMHDTEATTARLKELKSLGIRLAIDDFGTGYSSLSYLRRFPVDVIKIDKSFIDGLTSAGAATTLAKSIVKLAHNLELTTVAEGVEQQQQLARLSGMRCDFAQGYLFARPLDAPSATALLRTRSERLASAG